MTLFTLPGFFQSVDRLFFGFLKLNSFCMNACCLLPWIEMGIGCNTWHVAVPFLAPQAWWLQL